MTADTTTNAPHCVACRREPKSTGDLHGWRPFQAGDGVGHWCGGCYSAARLENLKGYRWLPRPTNQPPPPPRQVTSRRRTSVRIADACGLCGIAADPEWPPIHFTLAGVAISAPRCAPCDGAVVGLDFDALEFLRGVHGREQLTPDDFYAGVCLQHDRLGVRRPPPAQAPWQF